MDVATATLVTLACGGLGAGVAGLALFARGRRAAGATRAEISALRSEVVLRRGEAADREALLRSVVEATPAALVLYADGGRIVFTNTAAREMFFASGDVEGENFLPMLDRAPESLRRALLAEGDEIFTVEQPGGPETFYLSKRYFDLAGDPHTLIAVKQVTQEVSRSEIGALKKVIRIINHEINNSLAPMSSLLGSARTILGRPEHLHRLGTVLETVEDRARHLQTFIDRYARFARTPDPKPTRVEWAGFLTALGALYPGVQVTPGGPDSGFFDAGLIQQVIINLIKNGVEAGSAERDISLSIAAVPEGGLRIEVADRGRGMNDEVMKSAALPFFTTKPLGSGLGLALCREIVELHRGRLFIDRREGGGMRIWFTLPDRPGARAVMASHARLTLTRA
jgi:two-component system, NtrC family, nitrogen regulation sensor histidine kinase NtrY